MLVTQTKKPNYRWQTSTGLLRNSASVTQFLYDSTVIFWLLCRCPCSVRRGGGGGALGWAMLIRLFQTIILSACLLLANSRYTRDVNEAKEEWGRGRGWKKIVRPKRRPEMSHNVIKTPHMNAWAPTSNLSIPTNHTQYDSTHNSVIALFKS